MRNRLLLAGAALAAFGASLVSGFHFDDYAIFSDRVLTQVSGWKGIFSPVQTRPLTYLSFWFNYLIGGGDPLGYHLINLGLHIGAALAAFACLKRLMPERAALAAAALFAVHPIQAEAVNYVWARGILLAALFCFLALREWLEGRRWAAVAWFAVALLGKEECAAFPLILLVIDRIRQEAAPLAKRLVPIGAMLALSVAAGARVIYAAMALHQPVGAAAGVKPLDYFLAQGISIWRYLRLLVWPFGFTVDAEISVPPVWLGALLWVVVIAAAVWAWRKGGAALWLAAGLILLLPSSSIFPAADLSADRRMYLPLFCFAAPAGLLLARVRTQALAATVAAALLLISLGRDYVWMDDARLWREAVRRSPNKVRPKIQLSRSVPARDALELLTAAREIAPLNGEVAAEMGRVFLEERQYDAALQEFGRAVALNPDEARNFNNRGVAFEGLGLLEAARSDFNHAVTLDPGLTEAQLNLQKLPPAQ
jgi:protein O-mannosyl-transferase